MKLVYSRDLCGYYNGRIEGVANAVRYLDPSNMSNGYNDMAYGFNKHGELVINIGHQINVNIVFRDTRMELYHANSYGVITSDKHEYIDYSVFNGVNDECARKFVDMKIKAFSSITLDNSYVYAMEQHELSPIFNKTWHSHMNHNIEQIRDAYDFIGTDNMRCGQAYIAISTMSRLCFLLHHHDSFKQHIDTNDLNNVIIVECDGDGVITIYDADEYGMPKEEQTVNHFDRVMDSHGTGKRSHEKFIEKVKKNHGVYLV